MLWEGWALRDIHEDDIRRLVETGLEEHLQLEYKSELYRDNDQGRREFLLDVGMFANTTGGILLIGIPERRDDQGQATGAPDGAAVLGLDLPNPEAILAAYDARVMESIEECLPLESAAIDVANGRRVLALRVPNSTNKPHSVRHQGHIYFPARRERQRYSMNVREIKELVMRTANRLQEAKGILKNAFLEVLRLPNLPYLMIGIIPIFFEDFLIDVRRIEIHRSVGNFSRVEPPRYQDPIYSFDGIERREDREEYTVRFCRNGLLTSSCQLLVRLGNPISNLPIPDAFVLTFIDVQLRRFMMRAKVVYETAGISPPFLLGMTLRTQRPLVGAYAGLGGFGEEHTEPVPARDYVFPFMEVDDLSVTDRIIRPLCDQAHQLFGREGSPSFNAAGAWTARYP